MKILILLGSRNSKGQTSRACSAFLLGAENKGAECEKIFLPSMKIERCRQCDENGWGICRTEGKCVIEDDLHVLIE